jgi:hypothetical protein
MTGPTRSRLFLAFIAGMGSMLDPFGRIPTFRRYVKPRPIHRDPDVADMVHIYSDWVKVGGDLECGMRQVEGSVGTKGTQVKDDAKHDRESRISYA